MVAVSPRVQYPRPLAADRPYLVVVRSASPSRLDPAVYRRRRLLVGGVVLLLIAAALILAQSVLARAGGGPLAATGAAGTPRPISQSEWVVHPGDTLWSIAAALDPNGDERSLVDKLAAEAGGTTLYPGEVIRLPSDLHS